MIHRLVLISSVLLYVVFFASAVHAQLPVVRIGIVVDGPWERNQEFVEAFREEILTFLYHADIEATNWPAEQAMRPAVVNRKVFGGNRTWSGAAAQERLGSFFASCGKNAIAALDTLARIICQPAPIT